MSTESTWGGGPRERQTFYFMSETVSTDDRFFSPHDLNEAGAIDNLREWSLGRPYLVVEFGAKVETDPGSTEMTLHRNKGAAEWTGSDNPGAAETWMRHYPNFEVGADDDLALGFDMSNFAGDVRGYFVVEFLD